MFDAWIDIVTACFDNRDDEDAPEATRAPRWLKYAAVILIVAVVVGVAFFWP